MAGSQRYLRYILVAFVALVLIFFISASSGVGPGQGYTQKASDLLKGQGSLYKGSDSNSVPAGGAPGVGGDSKVGEGVKSVASEVQSAVLPEHTEGSSVPPSSGSSAHDTTSPNPGSSSLSAGQNALPGAKAPGPRMNATFVTLARNSDVWEISRSIRQVEDRFNHAYSYDWVFLNDADFDDTFIKVTTALTSGKPAMARSTPRTGASPTSSTRRKRAKCARTCTSARSSMEIVISYRHMCRYESGFFFRHELLLEYEWYWRVEPSIELFCDIAYDPFRFMAETQKEVQLRALALRVRGDDPHALGQREEVHEEPSGAHRGGEQHGVPFR